MNDVAVDGCAAAASGGDAGREHVDQGGIGADVERCVDDVGVDVDVAVQRLAVALEASTQMAQISDRRPI